MELPISEIFLEYFQAIKSFSYSLDSMGFIFIFQIADFHFQIVKFFILRGSLLHFPLAQSSHRGINPKIKKQHKKMQLKFLDFAEHA